MVDKIAHAKRKKLGTGLSEWKFVNGVVLQDTILGPFAFLIMVNSLLTMIDGTVKLFDIR